MKEIWLIENIVPYTFLSYQKYMTSHFSINACLSLFSVISTSFTHVYVLYICACRAYHGHLTSLIEISSYKWQNDPEKWRGKHTILV